MMQLFPIDPPFSLKKPSSRITSSSNFRFAWQFYGFNGMDPRSAEDVHRALDFVARSPACHEFLRNSFDPMYEESFSIDSPHAQSKCVPGNQGFVNILASAAGDHLGAYSTLLRDATASESAKVLRLFSGHGEFFAFQLSPADGRSHEELTSHLFSNWFYGVAWDWCFLVTWPETKHLWLGCLTDTD